jgi:hypothetical protein
MARPVKRIQRIRACTLAALNGIRKHLRPVSGSFLYWAAVGGSVGKTSTLMVDIAAAGFRGMNPALSAYRKKALTRFGTFWRVVNQGTTLVSFGVQQAVQPKTASIC